jgi:hypothetical protein
MQSVDEQPKVDHACSFGRWPTSLRRVGRSSCRHRTSPTGIRGRVASGPWGYDRRGILDETHLRFFSRRSLLRTVRGSGLEVEDLRYTGLPFDVLAGRDPTLASRIARWVDRTLVRLRPTLSATSSSFG